MNSIFAVLLAVFGSDEPPRATIDLCEVMEEVRPDTVVTFGPDGYTGHPDHRAVSRWAGLMELIGLETYTAWVGEESFVAGFLI